MGNEDNQKYSTHEQVKHKRGPSSFWIHDPKVVFDSLALKPNDWFLDIGCGPGNYSIEASRIVGNSGVVYALDKDPIMVEELETIAYSGGIKNLKTIVADITKSLPVADNSMDVCFIATVLHIPAVSKNIMILFNEVCRVLKPGGRLVIIECKKEDMPFGPPTYMRLSPTDIENSAQKHDFKKLSIVDLGYNYMIQFAFHPNKQAI